MGHTGAMAGSPDLPILLITADGQAPAKAHDAQTGAMHQAIADDDRVIVSGYGLVHNRDIADF